MNRPISAHLDYDQMLQALVDKSDLTHEAQEHLAVCTSCQHQVKRLVQRYDRLGEMAKKMAPGPTQPFRVPDRPAASARWQFKPALALGMVGFLILGLTLWWPKQYNAVDAPAPMAAQTSEVDDDALMDEIDALVADALPAAYQEVAGVSDAQSIEDLIEWIVPSIEEEEALEPRA